MTQASNADPEAKAFPEYMGARFGAKFAVCSKDPDEKEIAELVKCADGAENIIFSSCNAHLFRGQLALAAALAEMGVPILCSCGVRGEWNHTDREYALVESMFERPKLWAAVVLAMNGFSAE